MFSAWILTRNIIKTRSIYNDYKKEVDGGGLQSFSHFSHGGFARKFVIFGVNNSSSSYSENSKNNFQVLSKGQLVKLMIVLVNLTFYQIKAKFCLSLCFNGDNSYGDNILESYLYTSLF